MVVTPINPAPVATRQPFVGTAVAPVAPMATQPSSPGSILRDAFSGFLNAGSNVLNARINSIAADELARHAYQPDHVDLQADRNRRTSTLAPQAAPTTAAGPFGLSPLALAGLAGGAVVLFLLLRK